MKHTNLLFISLALLTAVSTAQAYLCQVSNTTSGTIKVTINLAACTDIEVGEVAAGQKSKIFDTGACCFASVAVKGTSGAVKGFENKEKKPWGTPIQCFQNLNFSVYEKQEHGQTTGIGLDLYNLAG